jgi:xanthine dehydrogenase accessory factor
MFESSVEGVAIMQHAVELSQAGESFVLATVVWRQGPSSGQNGSRAIVTADGQLHGWIGGACAEPVILSEAKKVLAEGKPRLIWLGQEHELSQLHIPEGVLSIPISCQSDGALQIYIEPMQAAPLLTIVGRSPMAMTLEKLAADLNWTVKLIDVNDFTGGEVIPNSWVIIATQGHGDEEAIELALTKNPSYLGVVASRKRGQVVKDYLASRKVSAEQIDKIRIPCGLDLGHTSHREVAVAILAELVKLRAAGEVATPKKELPLLAQEINQVIDPVCKMTVVAEKANRPYEYNGTVYYFCAPGCRSAFESDPTAFLAEEAKC